MASQRGSPDPTATAVTVLVVDDELAVRELLRDLLAQWGYEVVTADTGKRALELLETRLFDAALLDMWIGDTDGLQLLRAIQQQDSGVALMPLIHRPPEDPFFAGMRGPERRS